MKRILPTILLSLVLIFGIIMGILSGFSFSETQKETLFILAIICLVSVLYCFIVGELSGNNSQMDKLWSILPVVYIWVITAKDNFAPRLMVMAILITLWGIRLTFNFARKGAYRLKFWEGEEDYRWGILRANSILKNRFLWLLFNLIFISFYQNALVLAITLPGVAIMGNTVPLGIIDLIATIFALAFLVYEFIADEQQNKFQSEKWKMIKAGQALEDLPIPYNKGFNTIGLWAYSRHPNYLGEQAMWVCIYLFVIGAGLTKYLFFNWSIVGSMLLILLFIGSSTLSEVISSKKYPQYVEYQQKVSRYLPFRKYSDK